jgi:hypothetical protein
MDEVRRRDRDRLTLQRSGGLHAGREEPPERPMQPEPLVPPIRRHDEGRARDEAAE